MAALFTVAKTWKQPTGAFMDGYKDKQNVVYTYNGILFSFYKEGHSDTCYNTDGP